MTEHARPAGIMPGLPLFTILGFEVRLNLSWLILGFLIAWTLAEGFFPQNFPDLGARTRWLMGLAGAVGILFSIVFHELSHSLVARFYGLPMGGITLFMFGGVAEMRSEPKTPRTEFLMAAAGPAASLVLAAAFYLLHGLAQLIGLPVPIIGVLYYLIIINVVLAIFNLIPAFPMDGGRMFRAALWGWRGDLRKATHIASRCGGIFGLVLIVLGILNLLGGAIVSGIWAILIGTFVRQAAQASYRQLLMRQALEGETVGDLMDDRPTALPQSMTVAEFLEKYASRRPYRLYPVVDGDKLTGCVNVARIRELPADQRATRTVSDIATACSDENTVSPDEPAIDLMDSMLSRGAGDRKIVVRDGRLVGTLSLDELRNIIMVRTELELSAH
jgi:Zn-dependent protease/CBS domain-containing protein